jgi:lipoyl(octanoyl) transferase
MNPDANSTRTGPKPTVLDAYLLGTVPFEAALRLQRQLVYRISGDRTQAALVLCEHPPLVTVGRQGNLSGLRCDPEELRRHGWSVRGVNRGGGCLVHAPGQFAVYPVLPLDRLGLGLAAYMDRLIGVLIGVLEDCGVTGAAGVDRTAVRVGGRMVAGVGVAVRDWVAYFGAYLNVHPDLTLFRAIHGDQAVTSVERERRGPVRPALVRERLLERLAEAFGLERITLLFSPPLIGRAASQPAAR